MRDYWSRDPLLVSAIFPYTMLRDRFDVLTSTLHFANSESQYPKADGLWMLRPVLDVLNKHLLLFSSPTRPSLWMKVCGPSRGTIMHCNTCPGRGQRGELKFTNCAPVKDQKQGTPLPSKYIWCRTMGAFQPV